MRRATASTHPVAATMRAETTTASPPPARTASPARRTATESRAAVLPNATAAATEADRTPSPAPIRGARPTGRGASKGGGRGDRMSERSLREHREQVDAAAHGALEIDQRQALVLAVGIGVRVLHSDQQCGSAAEGLGEGADEGDASAAADEDRLLAIAGAERSPGLLEDRTGRVGHPPGVRQQGPDLRFDPPWNVRLEV